MYSRTDERKFLERMAKAGGGQVYEAVYRLELKQLFEAISMRLLLDHL